MYKYVLTVGIIWMVSVICITHLFRATPISFLKCQRDSDVGSKMMRKLGTIGEVLITRDRNTMKDICVSGFYEKNKEIRAVRAYEWALADYVLQKCSYATM